MPGRRGSGRECRDFQGDWIEAIGTLFARLDGLGLSIAEQVREGRITVQQVDPAEMSPVSLLDRPPMRR